MATGSGDDATARAAAAAQRISEVEDRLRALHAGEPSTPEDVRRAEQAAKLAEHQNEGAYRRAAQAHVDSARSHRQASEMYDGAGHSAQAAEHRRMATVDDQGARDDAAAAADHDPHA